MRTLAILLLTAAAGCDSTPAGSSAPPAITLRDLDDKPFELALNNRITVVVFTRTDCPIANRAAPEWRTLVEEWSPQGVAFHLVYVDPHEPVEAIRLHLKEYDLPGVPLRDPQHALVTHCGATTTPEVVLFNNRGKIVYQGAMTSAYRAVGQPDAGPVKRWLHQALAAVMIGEPVDVPKAKAAGCLIADLKD